MGVSTDEFGNNTEKSLTDMLEKFSNIAKGELLKKVSMMTGIKCVRRYEKEFTRAMNYKKSLNEK